MTKEKLLIPYPSPPKHPVPPHLPHLRKPPHHHPTTEAKVLGVTLDLSDPYKTASWIPTITPSPIWMPARTSPWPPHSYSIHPTAAGGNCAKGQSGHATHLFKTPSSFPSLTDSKLFDQALKGPTKPGPACLPTSQLLLVSHSLTLLQPNVASRCVLPAWADKT